MKRAVEAILAERAARIEAIKSEYSEDAVKTSTMLADIINADYLTPESRASAFAANGITEEAAELNRKVLAVIAEYAAELEEAQNNEDKSYQGLDWMREILGKENAT